MKMPKPFSIRLSVLLLLLVLQFESAEAKAVIAMKDSAGKGRDDSVRMSGQNKSVLDGVQRLKDVTGVMNGKISDMENEIEAVSASGKDLAEIASVMSSSIQNIGSRIDEFKV